VWTYVCGQDAVEQRIQEPDKDEDSERDKSGSAKQDIKRKPT
jgi:hypothetical protein